MYNSKFCFEEGGAISQHLEGYEMRPQQAQMAEAVEEASVNKKNLIVEAGTGVGKSLAYLVPFIFWAVNENKRVVISTYTKALQNQLLIKDLPFLERALDVDFRYEICMGAENYVCLRKTNNNSAVDLFTSKRHLEQVDKILQWLEETETGLITDMEFVPDRSIWSNFSRESDLCIGKKCHWCNECYYRRSRIRQAQAQVLIVNHSLLFTDIMSESRVLPEYEALVLDEAHTLEDVATNHFGREISNQGVHYVIDGVSSLATGKSLGLEERGKVKSALEEAAKRAKELDTVSSMFFASLEKSLGDAEGIQSFDREMNLDLNICESLVDLAETLSLLSLKIEDPEASEEAKGFARRCSNMADTVDFLFNAEGEGYVYWVEVRKRKDRMNYSFHAAPIDISDLMREHVFDSISPVVLTSATLSVSSKGDFSFIKDRLGVDNATELALDSPFDHKKNVLLYLPKTMADPTKRLDDYRRQVTEEIIKIHDIMGGRIFALFTSYDMMNKSASEILKTRGDINILKQGDLPRYVLLDVFKKNPDTVLMGTTTFWQGVDVPGSALECVIITKLPFAVPTDPVNSSRINELRKKGHNPFNEYQVPQAVIMFRQGVGRLIRSHSDRGVVAVLDPRVTTRYYGQKFLSSFHGCKRTANLEDVNAFFGGTSIEWIEN